MAEAQAPATCVSWQQGLAPDTTTEPVRPHAEVLECSCGQSSAPVATELSEKLASKACEVPAAEKDARLYSDTWPPEHAC